MRVERPDHAFVIPAYKNSPFLAECVRSLQHQTIFSRIVIATSTPSDYIARIAEENGVALKVNPVRRGIGSDWNFALAVANARYVTLAHQDDLYDLAFLERSLDLFARYPEGGLSFTGYREIADDGVPRKSKISVAKTLITRFTIGGKERVRGRSGRLYLSFGNPLPCSSVTFDLEKLADFRFSEEFASNLDWEAWWRLQRQGLTFLHCPEALIGRRYNDLTETANAKRNGRRWSEDRAMFRRIWPPGFGDALALAYRAGY